MHSMTPSLVFPHLRPQSKTLNRAGWLWTSACPGCKLAFIFGICPLNDDIAAVSASVFDLLWRRPKHVIRQPSPRLAIASFCLRHGLVYDLAPVLDGDARNHSVKVLFLSAPFWSTWPASASRYELSFIVTVCHFHTV